jgi:hypothetical protein
MVDRKRTAPVNGRGKGGPLPHLLRTALPVILLCWLFGLFGAASAGAAELQIPPLKAKAGQEIRVPVLIDQVGNLAGVKLVLHYDKDLLTFKEGNKTPATQSLMHIINDRTPGRLIIVMAGARGIQGKGVTILTLDFTVKKGIEGSQTTQIEVPEVQLMGDDLKEIECKTKPGTIVIQP